MIEFTEELLPTSVNQNGCPSIHLLFYQATAQAVHMIQSLGIPAYYYAPRHDHPDHPMPARMKKYRSSNVVKKKKCLLIKRTGNYWVGILTEDLE